MPEISIDDVQHIIDELEDINEERLRAKVQLEYEMKLLKKLGCSSLEESEKKLKEYDSKIDKVGAAVEEEFEDFIEDYGNILE
ncbi:MAG: hypothetical protein DRO67_01980 [Candidatus Asgardarchaeum californiense]|nr:MAG: hypothetical protein DRO67_01980 [Candidatus Asgardarchaeum californiense]